MQCVIRTFWIDEACSFSWIHCSACFYSQLRPFISRSEGARFGQSRIRRINSSLASTFYSCVFLQVFSLFTFLPYSHRFPLNRYSSFLNWLKAISCFFAKSLCTLPRSYRFIGLLKDFSPESVVWNHHNQPLIIGYKMWESFCNWQFGLVWFLEFCVECLTLTVVLDGSLFRIGHWTVSVMFNFIARVFC